MAWKYRNNILSLEIINRGPALCILYLWWDNGRKPIASMIGISLNWGNCVACRSVFSNYWYFSILSILSEPNQARLKHYHFTLLQWSYSHCNWGCYYRSKDLLCIDLSKKFWIWFFRKSTLSLTKKTHWRRFHSNKFPKHYSVITVNQHWQLILSK